MICNRRSSQPANSEIYWQTDSSGRPWSFWKCGNLIDVRREFLMGHDPKNLQVHKRSWLKKRKIVLELSYLKGTFFLTSPCMALIYYDYNVVLPLKILSSKKMNFLRYRLCGLVVRVPGYRSGGLGFYSRRYQIFWEVVGLERGPLSLVRIIKELLERQVATPI
jgi:hypothetical protein